MNQFTDIQQNTPRLVVEFTRPEPDKEQFKWGIVGSIPVLTLIGYIVRVQAELGFMKPKDCDQMALVIVWNVENHKFDYFVNEMIPVDSLVGMLEIIKLHLIGTQMGQQQDQRTKLFGPDGSILRR